MDSEEYYDSLEEDSSYGSLDGTEEPTIINQTKNTQNPSKIPVKTRTRPQEKKIEVNCTYEDDIIPFYDQNLSKSEIELKKMFLNHGCEGDGQKNNTKKKFNKKMLPVRNVMSKFKSNSYLDMFYAKNGVEKIDFSNRATCADLSPKSYTTCENLDLATSVYLSEIESVYSSQNVKNGDEFSLSLTSLDSKFCSVSQINGYINNSIKPKNKMIYVAKPNKMKVPEMGNLGPEIPKDKLELLKKRQDYGQKVSRKNKIKMIEKKLLQNLQQEIRECNKIA